MLAHNVAQNPRFPYHGGPIGPSSSSTHLYWFRCVRADGHIRCMQPFPLISLLPLSGELALITQHIRPREQGTISGSREQGEREKKPARPFPSTCDIFPNLFLYLDLSLFPHRTTACLILQNTLAPAVHPPASWLTQSQRRDATMRSLCLYTITTTTTLPPV